MTSKEKANEDTGEEKPEIEKQEGSQQEVSAPVVESKSEETKARDGRKASEAKAPTADVKMDQKPSLSGAAPRKSMLSERSIDLKVKQSKTKESKDTVSVQESKKSILSLGQRASKDIPKDLFTRRKSSRSIGKAVGSIISFRRGSIAEYFDRQKTAKYMNTYKLESEKPFNVDKVEKILKEVLTEALDNLTYDADKVPKQAKWASNVIRSKVKEQEYERYKLICNVTIGEKRSQDMYATYRFLWDAERDKHASYVHENMYVFAIAVCFGIYYE